jgi:hypothetical protein
VEEPSSSHRNTTNYSKFLLTTLNRLHMQTFLLLLIQLTLSALSHMLIYTAVFVPPHEGSIDRSVLTPSKASINHWPLS